MLVGFIDGGVCVERIYYIARVGTSVPDFDRDRICNVGHGALFRMLVEGRNGAVVFKGIGVVY